MQLGYAETMNLRLDFHRLSPLALILLCHVGLGESGASAEPVVQPLPSAEVQRLNRALVDLAKRPRDLGALLEAGDAAVAVNDLDAAGGFFERARELDEDNPAAQLGLGRVALRRGRPVEALERIERSLAMGAQLRDVLGERGLALDMVGEQALAQADYRDLLESDADPAITRRLAVSYAIEGRLADFERTLRPQIERRDPAAFRTRTFGLAIMGQETRAAAIVDAVMPAGLANELTPYLAVMPRLTPAQQAAAANLGIFPGPADVGRDTPQIARYAAEASAAPQTMPVPVASPPAQPAERVADARLAPRGAPLGAAAPAAIATERTPASSPPPPPPRPAPTPASAPKPVSRPPESVAEAFADIDVARGARVTPAAGAVDLASIEIPREAPPAPEPAPEPDHPSRIWVQVATGRDLDALGFDWRRLARKAPDLLGDFTPHTVPWGEANRLLAGPITSESKARDLINQLKGKGIDTFAFTSPEGLAIQELE